MAHSYNDFVTKATQSGMLGKFSQEDLTIAKNSPEYGLSLLSLMQDEQKATTAEGRLLATEAANQLRKNYGLQTQAAQKQSQIDAVGSFTYSKEDDYQKLTDAVVNQPAFSYDKDEDPVYMAMRQSAIRDSQRAVEDTLARASVGTGGVPSSYAVTAAQQAANNHLGKLNDAVPTLYQNALAEYENELGMNLKRLAALEGDRGTEYQLYLDKLTQLETELKDLKAQQAAGEENLFAMRTGIAEAERAQNEQNLSQLQKNELAAAQLMAEKGDYSRLAKVYGLTPDEVKILMGGEPDSYNQVYDSNASGRPLGLTGHGLLTNTGNKAEVKVTTNAGKTGVTSVPVMQAQDGSLWYWDHMQHKYVPFKVG